MMGFDELPIEEITALAEPEQVKDCKDTNAVLLFKLCLEDLGVVPFRAQDTGTLYARFPMQGHYKIAGLKSEEFRAWLTLKFYKARGKEPSTAEIEGAIRLMESSAWEKPKCKIFVRWARLNGKIYLDLCDEEHRSVEIDEDGWMVVENSPAWFIRTSSMKPLPEPLAEGCLTQLREIVHLSDEDFVILCGWLVAACNPEGPFPLLALSAEAGSGKSFLTAVLKKIVDDDVSPKLAPFKDVDAIFAAAASHWILAYDNLTRLTPEDSDHLCRVATGAGYSKRKLYTDNDEYTTSAARPVILNGITVPVTKMDLTDRSYFIRLPPIPPEKRRTEKDLWRAFDQMRPYLLGALLTAVSRALRQKDYSPANPPRMADAAEFTLQAEKGGGLPWPEGTFSAVLAKMEAAKKDEAISENAVASTLLDLSGNGGWEGSLKELLTLVHQGRTPEELRFLPGTSNTLSRRIEEVKPFLRSKSVRVEKQRVSAGYRVTIARVSETKPQDFSAVDCRIAALSTCKVHSGNPDEHKGNVDNVDSVDMRGISSVREEKKSGYPGFESEVFLEGKQYDGGKSSTFPTQSTQKQQPQGLAECRWGVDDVESPPVATDVPPKGLRLDAQDGEEALGQEGGQGTLLFQEDEPIAPMPKEPSSPHEKVLYSPEMARAWLEAQPEEVKGWHAETLKRLDIIGVPAPEETALLRTWQQFGKTS